MSKNKTTNSIEDTKDESVQHSWQDFLQHGWQDFLQGEDATWYWLGLGQTSQSSGLQSSTTNEPIYYDGVEYLSTKAYNGFFGTGGYLEGGDWSGIPNGELQVSGQVLIGDKYFAAQTMEWRALDPVPTGDPFVANWMTDYAQLILKVSTDDGMHMVFTMNANGFSAHIVRVDYEVDSQGDPLGAMPDIGKPFITEFTREAIEEILGYHWEPAPGQYDNKVAPESVADVSLNELIVSALPTKVYAGAEHPGGLTSSYDELTLSSGGVSPAVWISPPAGELHISGNVSLSLTSSSSGESYYEVSPAPTYETVTSIDHTA